MNLLRPLTLAAVISCALPAFADKSQTREMLDEHNRARSAHCAPPLSWSAKLARVAQRCQKFGIELRGVQAVPPEP